MSPRGKRGELPKTVIRPGALGYLPLNLLTFSYFANGYGDTLLGFRDTDETLGLKSKTTVSVKDGKNRRELSLEGHFFNSYTDALYRGRLPEVLVAAPASDALTTFLEDFVEYVEKLMALGFFVPKKEILKKDPVSELIPCVVLTGSGLLFSRFITGLVRYLRDMETRYPLLTEAVRHRIIARFVRGVPEGENTDSRAITRTMTGEAALTVQNTQQFELLSIPRAFRIAGGNRHTQDVIRTTLTAQGLGVHIEDRVQNAAERLEFESALWRLSTVILPALTESHALPEEMAPLAEAGLLAIAQRRQAFAAGENLESILGAKSKRARKSAGSSTPARPKAEREDREILYRLSHYANALGLGKEEQLFEQLASQLSETLISP